MQPCVKFSDSFSHLKILFRHLNVNVFSYFCVFEKDISITHVDTFWYYKYTLTTNALNIDTLFNML